MEEFMPVFVEGKFSAFVQLADAVEACAARVVLNGQNIYDGCCTLRIDFSKNRSLEVKMNTDKQHDYTRSDLPTDMSSSAAASGLVSSSNSSNPISAMMNAFANATN